MLEQGDQHDFDGGQNPGKESAENRVVFTALQKSEGKSTGYGFLLSEVSEVVK